MLDNQVIRLIILITNNGKDLAPQRADPYIMNTCWTAGRFIRLLAGARKMDIGDF